jgi:putative membrane protein
MVMLLSCGFIAAGIASVTALAVAQKILKVLPGVNYRTVMVSTCGALIFIVWLITGCTGVVVMAVGVCIGILPVLMNVRRSHCMGVLLFPILLYYLNPNF